MSKKSIISLGLQRVFLIRQNMIVQSVLLEQETESGHPLSPGFCSIMGFLSTTEKTELMFFSLTMYTVPFSSTVHLPSVVHDPSKIGESWLGLPRFPAPPQECKHTMSQHCISSTARDAVEEMQCWLCWATEQRCLKEAAQRTGWDTMAGGC